VATTMTKIEGDKIREGELDNDELALIVKHWKNNLDLPIWWNFASNFRMSQMRALVVEAIRRHNVGLIVVDHFRMFDPDRRINNANQEDEAKARFLKEDIAKDLNVAVVCLAHTVKQPREGDGRPRLADLRGSGQVAAHADIVAMMYRPYMYATENEKLEGVVSPTDAEMLFRKNRSGALGASDFFFDPATMTIRDAW
jgi:replicative DNA helicase